MSILDDLPQMFDEAFQSADIMYDLTLTRTTVVGGNEWDPSSGTAVPAPYSGRGFVEKFTDFEIANGMAQENERKITIMAYSISVVPRADDVVEILGSSYRVTGPVEADPSRSIYTMRAGIT